MNKLLLGVNIKGINSISFASWATWTIWAATRKHHPTTGNQMILLFFLGCMKFPGQSFVKSPKWSSMSVCTSTIARHDFIPLSHYDWKQFLQSEINFQIIINIRTKTHYHMKKAIIIEVFGLVVILDCIVFDSLWYIKWCICCICSYLGVVIMIIWWFCFMLYCDAFVMFVVRCVYCAYLVVIFCA